MTCLTDEQIEALALATSKVDIPPSWQLHLDQCPACQQREHDCKANQKLADEIIELFGGDRSPQEIGVLTEDLTRSSSDELSSPSRVAEEVGFPADIFPGYRVLRELHL